MEQLCKFQNRGQLFNDRNKYTLPNEVFGEYGHYLNVHTLFLSYFNAIPNFTHEIKIDCPKAIKWLLETYPADIKDCHFDKRYMEDSKESLLHSIYFLLYEDLIIEFSLTSHVAFFLFRLTDVDKVQSIINSIKQFKKKKEKELPEISIVVDLGDGLELKNLRLIKPKLNISDNYNDDFLDIHKIILKRLSKKEEKGLLLLYGKPGTGKTSYIRYLTMSLNKEVIFLPSSIATGLTNPQFIGFLSTYPNSVFVIEDAEMLLTARDNNGNSTVAALLNLTDGLLSDCLNIQVICSFNTDISKVDSALLRKGRLIAKYEFKELETQKAQALSDKLGFKSIISQPMTLTEIYNQEERDFTDNRTRKTIGFRVD